MVAVALCAFLLALAAWNFRQLEALRLERIHAEHARALAEERAAALARSAQAAAKLGSADQPNAGSLSPTTSQPDRLLCRNSSA
jgi:hypothetical protein